MFDYSVFKQNSHMVFPYVAPISPDYKVYVNGQEVPVYTCRVSAYPFNTWWPGHQRDFRQTMPVSYVNLVSDEAIQIAVEPLTKKAYQRIMLKPYSKQVETTVEDGKICFTLRENVGYVLELDDYFNFLYIFNNKPILCEDPSAFTYYFGKGIHFPGKIVLRTGESLYVDKDALVFGRIYAENAEDIYICGNGIFDDSSEERISDPCTEPYINGNLKLINCKNVRVEGIGLCNSASYCISAFHCFDVDIRSVRIFGQWRYNTDGIDMLNCQRIHLQDCFVHSFDDTICIKGLDCFGFENNTDILVEGCTLWCDWGRTMELGLETECREYKNITFRNCDVLRGCAVACDIQNGDRAEVHHITFENIRLELESFYTPMQLQKSDDEVYDRKNEIEIPQLLAIINPRYRDSYSFLEGIGTGDQSDAGKPHFASVHDITVRDVTVYCDDVIAQRYGTKAVTVFLENQIPTALYQNITVENVVCNGIRLTRDDMTVLTENIDPDILTIR